MLDLLAPYSSPLKRVPHAYTTPSSPDAARCWVPCVDNLWEKCTWEFEFVVPRYLEERESRNGDGDEDEVADAIPTLVVCSGELVEQVMYSFDLLCSFILSHSRWRIPITRIRPSSCSRWEHSHPCNRLLLPRDHLIYSRFQ